MKICSKCGKQKEESEFFVKEKISGRLHAQCKQCYKIHRKSYYDQHYAKYGDEYRKRANIRRDKVRKELHDNMVAFLKNKTCIICGEPDVRTFEFDHIEPALKSFGISQGIRAGKKWVEILEEIKKCRILCANCHKIHTANQRGWYKTFTE